MSSTCTSRACARRSTRVLPSRSSIPSAVPATTSRPSEPRSEPEPREASGRRGTVLRLLRTNAFRLAVLYLGLFATSVLALLAFIYWSTADFIEKQTEATLDAEIAGLAEQYDQRGLSGLVQVIAERSAGERGDAMLYLITDPLSHPLAGNLSAWPDAEVIRPGWIGFPVEVGRGANHATHIARATTFTIPGGYRLLVGRDLRDASVFRQRVANTLAWAGVLTLGLGLAGGAFMSRNMLRRVEAVSNTTAEIIHGDLGKRVPLSGSGDEFDQLAANLNAMLDQIERLMAGMRQVTDNIAHDLRTPLSRLRARLEVTLLERPDAARAAEVMRETINEADRLLGTFNALLSIAEAESGARRTAMEEVDLAEIAGSVAELYEPLAEEKGLAFSVAASAGVRVRGDRHLLAQATANLLDNAIKYTSAGSVRLAVTQDEGGAAIAVADTGPGIPEDRREAVFDRFVRLEGSRSTPGNGLGLSLVRAVALLHGGTVVLDGNGPGLRAVFRMPAAALATG
ncbi:MAG: HAMP domain-containing histidine kinase [Alphaproteobacteria bacterium]|nr:HAMP domain-containing histidine kinase [Alphaproteobacteria bacterium]